MASFVSRLIYLPKIVPTYTKRLDHLFLQLTFVLKNDELYYVHILKIYVMKFLQKNVFIQLGKNCWRFVVLFLYH